MLLALASGSTRRGEGRQNVGFKIAEIYLNGVS